jgi:Leucine-rich repeat (LRR) protein
MEEAMWGRLTIVFLRKMEKLNDLFKITIYLLLFLHASCNGQNARLLTKEELKQKKEFKSLESALLKPKEVYKLSIFNNSLYDHLPKQIFSMFNLQVFSFTGNECDIFLDDDMKCFNIGELHEDIGKLSKLQELYLVMNELKNLPESIANLSNLKVLDLSDNPGIQIDNVYNLKNLEHLSLNGCDIKKLSSKITKMKSLKVLGLSNNEISMKEKEKIIKLLPECEIFF